MKLRSREEVMYTFRYDAGELALVGLHAGAAETAEDYGAAVASIERLAHDTNRRDGIAAMVVVVESDDAPDATWRKRIAAAESKAKRMCRALVTSNAVMLGVGAAIGWMEPQSGIERASYASFEEAVAWIEARLERPMPVLPRLLAELRAGQSDRA